MSEIRLYTGKETCCGCGACWAACPTKAISMVEDEKLVVKISIF